MPCYDVTNTFPTGQDKFKVINENARCAVLNIQRC